MKKIKLLKLATIISFLIITYPGGTLTLNNLLWLIVIAVTSFIDLLCLECNHIEPIKNLLILLIILSSIYLQFKQNKFYIISSIAIQYLYLAYLFETKFLNYWYFTIPILIYLGLSLILVYLVFTRKPNTII